MLFCNYELYLVKTNYWSYGLPFISEQMCISLMVFGYFIINKIVIHSSLPLCHTEAIFKANSPTPPNQRKILSRDGLFSEK